MPAAVTAAPSPPLCPPPPPAAIDATTQVVNALVVSPDPSVIIGNSGVVVDAVQSVMSDDVSQTAQEPALRHTSDVVHIVAVEPRQVTAPRPKITRNEKTYAKSAAIAAQNTTNASPAAPAPAPTIINVVVNFDPATAGLGKSSGAVVGTSTAPALGGAAMTTTTPTPSVTPIPAPITTTTTTTVTSPTVPIAPAAAPIAGAAAAATAGGASSVVVATPPTNKYPKAIPMDDGTFVYPFVKNGKYFVDASRLEGRYTPGVPGLIPMGATYVQVKLEDFDDNCATLKLTNWHQPGSKARHDAFIVTAESLVDAVNACEDHPHDIFGFFEKRYKAAQPITTTQIIIGMYAMVLFIVLMK